MQELPVNTGSRPLSPKRFCTVFRVAENRMPDAGKMRPQLMRFTGNQLCLHKRYILLLRIAQRPAERPAVCTSLYLPLIDRHLICLPVLDEPALYFATFHDSRSIAVQPVAYRRPERTDADIIRLSAKEHLADKPLVER